MKTIEEKARAYDKVSKEVKDFFEGKQKMYSDVNQTLEYLFPELVESEDEKIKKAIIEGLREMKSNFHTISSIKIDDAIAWLEKQGEHKVEPKFEIGDWVINRTNAIIMQIVNNKDFYESVEIDGQRRTDSYNYADWDFRLWTIQDAKDGDVLAFKNDIPGIIICKSPTDYDTRSYCRLASDNLINKEESGWDSTLLVPATKEQRDLLFQKMHEAGYMWDSDSKQLLSLKAEPGGEQKPAWSEEDAQYVEDIIALIQRGLSYHTIEQVQKWLKSLKERIRR